MNHLEMACDARPMKPFCLMLFDLDRFKSINDSHGHAAGDAALKHVADVFREHLRPGDLFARLGGDEFGILLPATGKDEATSIAERAATDLNASPFQWRERHLEITASIGIASSRATYVQPDVIMEKADSALYETKRRGRNGVTVHDLDTTLVHGLFIDEGPIGRDRLNPAPPLCPSNTMLPPAIAQAR